MTAKVTYSSRTYVASSIIDSLSNQNPASWESLKSYNTGDRVTSYKKIYIAANPGISGVIAPNHNSGTASDGTVSWMFVGQARESTSINSNLYLALGGTSPWPNEDRPPEVQTDDNSLNEYKHDLLTLIRLNPKNIRLAVKRHIWTANQIYDKYDASKSFDDPNAYNYPFYVICRNENIYKCIDNNGGVQSTVEPTGRSLSFTTLADGYTWKYMGSIDLTDGSQFITENYIPVSIKTYDDGSDQWKVQQAARPGSLSTFREPTQVGLFAGNVTYEIVGSGYGAVPVITKDPTGFVTNITIFDGGTNYNRDAYITIKDDGVLGSGAELIATLTDGKLTGVTIENAGLGYEVAPTVIIDGDGINAEIELTINTTDGSIASATITNQGDKYSEINLIVIPGENVAYSKAIMAPPNGHGYNIVVELGSRTLIFTSRNNFSMKPYVLSGSESTYRQASLIGSVMSKNGSSPSLLIGDKHPDFGKGTLNEFDANRGFVIYVNNQTPITRSDIQEESVKIIMNI